jgi:cystathionine beta-synthase
MKIADRFVDTDVVVVLLPDSGERYLSKIYNDDWMRENGFLIPERISARYVMEAKGKKPGSMIAIDPTTTIRKALELMREHDISQLPVLENGHSVGSANDHELMTRVMEQPTQVDSPVRGAMGPGFPMVEVDAPLDEVIKLMTVKKNAAVLLQKDTEISGILTRYDVIEFMGK